jgi:16S rRNA (cytidine1402-2'-O)-methyltransferase
MSDPGAVIPGPKQWLFNGMRVATRTLDPGLHIVATPIGNLGDITIRALATLAAADTILAEDTRVAKKLTNHFGIRTPIKRFDAHANPRQVEDCVAELQMGKAIALISDAGTPLLSDPGSVLVLQAAKAGIRVYPLPGASALLSALVVAGLPADRFFFEGFLPSKSGDRRRRLKGLEAVPGALVFYEAPHRVRETLDDMAAVLGNRQAATARELTKLHEDVVRGSLGSLQEHFAQHEPRGEFVIVVSQPDESAAPLMDLDTRLQALLGTMSVKDAAAVAAAELGLPRRETYAKALLLQNAQKPGKTNGKAQR